MQGAHKRATGAYLKVREDCEFVSNAADGTFSPTSKKEKAD